MKKTLWRILWLIAVVFGGMTLVKVAVEVLNLSDKNYIEV